jgi:hypothetical protein
MNLPDQDNTKVDGKVRDLIEKLWLDHQLIRAFDYSQPAQSDQVCHFCNATPHAVQAKASRLRYPKCRLGPFRGMILLAPLPESARQ